MELAPQEVTELNAERARLYDELNREREQQLVKLRQEVLLVENRFKSELQSRSQAAELAIKARRRIVLVPPGPDPDCYHSSESSCGYVNDKYLSMTEQEAIQRGLKRHEYGCRYS
ncbi:hypothetical protein ACIA6T_11995 [Streptomyces sp. NPDC051740]|uniref:hypothetical protein n=1 Tax=Streptomyces sp. NPDC051740 TaxID=3365673 RepID=UPI0037B9AAF6